MTTRGSRFPRKDAYGFIGLIIRTRGEQAHGAAQESGAIIAADSMSRSLVLIIESDPNAISQMRRVLAGMKLRTVAVAGEEELAEALAALVRQAPALVIARVALPSGSGIR